MMIFDEFAAELQRELESKIDGVTIRSNRVRKNNGIELLGLSICSEGSSVAPTVYVKDYYSAYTSGVPIEKIASDIAHAYVNDKRFSLDVDANKFSNLDYVKSNIIYCLVNTDKNAELLNTAPHRDYLDLSIILKVLMRIDDDGVIASVTVKNEHLKYWGISDDTLFDWAKENTERLLPPKIMTMSGFMSELHGEDIEIPDDPMFIITNSNKCNGAGVILYHDLLKELSEKLNTELYLIPSSVHEFIAVRSDTIDDEDALHMMIQQVNSEVVDDMEILSDTLYKYSVADKLVKVA